MVEFQRWNFNDRISMVEIDDSVHNMVKRYEDGLRIIFLLYIDLNVGLKFKSQTAST